MTLRDRVRAALPEGAFLKRDRGDALYVTDAPRKGGVADIPGFCVKVQGDIARIFVDAGKLETLSRELGFAPDALADELSGFTGGSPGAAQLFSDILKSLEAGDGGYEELDRRLRQLAAVALRAGGGEGLYYCAMALAELNK